MLYAIDWFHPLFVQNRPSGSLLHFEPSLKAQLTLSIKKFSFNPYKIIKFIFDSRPKEDNIETDSMVPLTNVK